MNLRERVLTSLYFLEPCGVAKVWKVISQDLTSGHVARQSVYSAMYSMARDGLIAHQSRAHYWLTDRGRRRAKAIIDRQRRPLEPEATE